MAVLRAVVRASVHVVIFFGCYEARIEFLWEGIDGLETMSCVYASRGVYNYCTGMKSHRGET